MYMYIPENFDFVFLTEDIQRFISSSTFSISNIRGLSYPDLKEADLFLWDTHYATMNYDVMTYDVMTYDVMTYDVMIYDVMYIS